MLHALCANSVLNPAAKSHDAFEPITGDVKNDVGNHYLKSLVLLLGELRAKIKLQVDGIIGRSLNYIIGVDVCKNCGSCFLACLLL